MLIHMGDSMENVHANWIIQLVLMERMPLPLLNCSNARVISSMSASETQALPDAPFTDHTIQQTEFEIFDYFFIFLIIEKFQKFPRHITRSECCQSKRYVLQLSEITRCENNTWK